MAILGEKKPCGPFVVHFVGVLFVVGYLKGHCYDAFHFDDAQHWFVSSYF
jgi:hypothetical protein